MRRRDALEVLRSYIVERTLRARPRAQDIAGEPSAMPRLSQAAWVDVAQLCAGVPEETLRLLAAYWLSETGTEWTTQLVELESGEIEVLKEQVARRITLAQAAQLAGLDIGYHEARALYGHAIEVVTDNLVRRAGGEQEAA